MAKENHFVKQARLKREAAEKAAMEANATPNISALPPDPAGEAGSDDGDTGGDFSHLEKTTPAPTEKQVEEHIFGKENIQRAQAPTDDKILMDRSMVADMMKIINDFKARDGAVDLGAIKKQKRIIRVPVWSDYETGEDYIITGLAERVERDGARATTWNRGTEESQVTGLKVPITWIKPIMVNLKTLIQEEKEVRYDEFSNLVRVIDREVIEEKSVEVDMTPIASQGKSVEQANYEESGQFYKRVGTGVMVKLQVWGVKTTFTIEYEGHEYKIDQSVVNYK